MRLRYGQLPENDQIEKKKMVIFLLLSLGRRRRQVFEMFTFWKNLQPELIKRIPIFCLFKKAKESYSLIDWLNWWWYDKWMVILARTKHQFNDVTFDNVIQEKKRKKERKCYFDLFRLFFLLAWFTIKWINK